jgi:hypothetical protein
MDAFNCPAFVILRCDDYLDRAGDPLAAVTVVRVVWSQERADEETARLNQLQQSRGVESRDRWVHSRAEPLP